MKVKDLRNAEAVAHNYAERCAELLDCAGYLLELSAERIMQSRQVTAFAKIEKIVASRERIEYTKSLLLRRTLRSDAGGTAGLLVANRLEESLS
jgi:hypothetical protein